MGANQITRMDERAGHAQWMDDFDPGEVRWGEVRTKGHTQSKCTRADTPG